ncbi:MAG: hypothetical protein M0Q51_13460 [Bacteroidales bacterium]|nr:hypothetical protein [Bacteroidales bacterium]
MKELNLLFKNMKLKSIFLTCFMIIAGLATGQLTGNSNYIPQISLTAVNGFGPYVLGTQQQNKFTASDLPAQTSKVMFRFIDADSNQVGNAYVKMDTAGSIKLVVGR